VSDISQYLPFSQRPRRDESDVTNNWARHTGTVLLQIADVLSELHSASWQNPTLRPDKTVRQVVAELSWLLGSTRRERAASMIRGFFRARTRPAAVASAHIEETADSVPAELIARIRALAADALASSASRSLKELAAAVVAAYEITAATRSTITIDPIASGAVALARSLNGPLAIRAVIRERSLVATDADWVVGSGRAIEASAGVLVLFLYGRHGFPTAGS
jgi:hypothetical protein